MHPDTVPLSQLKLDPANIRQAGRGPDPVYKASIMKKGLIERLLVRPGPANSGIYLVMGGGKRLASLEALRDEGAIKADHPVKIEVREEGASEALDTSLTAAVVHTPMHPVDLYEAFVKLSMDGRSDEDLRHAYNLTARQFKQIMALGNLASEIREDWRAGVIKKEIAQIYTLEPDVEKQRRIYAKLKKEGGYRSDYQVREALKADNENASKLVQFIGIEEFRKKGGKVNEDLFGTYHATANVALAEKLAAEKLKAECERLKTDGWLWVLPASELPQGWEHNWQKLPAKPKYTAEEQARIEALDEIINGGNDDYDYNEEREANAELEAIEAAALFHSYSVTDKAKSGCAVDIDSEGELEITAGLLKPKSQQSPEEKAASREVQKVTPKEKKAKKAAAEDPDLSNSLAHRLSQTLTRAAAKAIEKDGNLGLDILIAGLLAGATDEYGGADGAEGISLRVSGLTADKLQGKEGIDFVDMLKRARKLGMPEKLKTCARIAGASFSFSWNDGANRMLDDDEIAIAVCNEIEPKDMKAALDDLFDAADYFNSVPKILCIRAITEALGGDAAHGVAGKPKGDIAKYAIANVPKTDWLPPELRTDHYTGPKGKKNGKK